MRERPAQPALIELDNALEPASSQRCFLGRHHAPDLFHLGGVGAGRFHALSGAPWPVDTVGEFLWSSVRSIRSVCLRYRAMLAPADQKSSQIRGPGKR